MATPPLPPEVELRSGESLLGQWDFHLDFTRSPVGSIEARFLLTSGRLIVLNLPRLRGAAEFSGRLSSRRSQFMKDMGSWHVMLDAALQDLPEPALRVVETGPDTSLSTRRALIIGEKHFWVGEDPRATEMLARIAQRWKSLRPLGAGSK